MKGDPASRVLVVAERDVSNVIRRLVRECDHAPNNDEPTTVAPWVGVAARLDRRAVILRDPPGENVTWTPADTAAAAFDRRGLAPRIAEPPGRARWMDLAAAANKEFHRTLIDRIETAAPWTPPSGATLAQGEVAIPSCCHGGGREALRQLWRVCEDVSLDPECGPFLLENWVDAPSVDSFGLARALPRGVPLPRWCEAWLRLGCRLLLPVVDERGDLVGLLGHACSHLETRSHLVGSPGLLANWTARVTLDGSRPGVAATATIVTKNVVDYLAYGSQPYAIETAILCSRGRPASSVLVRLPPIDPPPAPTLRVVLGGDAHWTSRRRSGSSR